MRVMLDFSDLPQLLPGRRVSAVSSHLHKQKRPSGFNQDGYLENMYEFYESTIPSSDFDQETKTFSVPVPEYSDPNWTPEPSKLTQQQLRELVAEWLG